MKPSEYPERMLKALVVSFDQYPGELSEPGLGFNARGLAASAGIISREEAPVFRDHWERGDSTFEFHGVVASDILAAVDNLEQRKMMRIVWRGTAWESECALLPTIPKGLEYGRFLNRSWFYRELWYPIKSNIKTVVIAVITAIIITILTTLILKWIGW